MKSFDPPRSNMHDASFLTDSKDAVLGNVINMRLLVRNYEEL